MFQQQMQMQMSAMEKHAEMNEKYLCRIAESHGQKKKCKRGEMSDDENDNNSSGKFSLDKVGKEN